jgi:hypothetical protein
MILKDIMINTNVKEKKYRKEITFVVAIVIMRNVT